MAITETITVDAGPAIDQLKALSDAADRAAAAMERIGKSAAGGGGADKLAASMSAAADRIEQASQRAAASMGRLSTAARSATGGLDAIAGSADGAAASEDRLAGSADAAAGALDKQAVAGDRAAKSSDAAAAGVAAGAESHSKLGEYALGAALVIGYATDKAMKFNAQMVMLNTQAGVSKNQLPELSKGVLQLAGQVGQSPGNLAESLYHVESNMASLGIKAPQALNMVKIAAEGADVGHANLVDTTNALTAAVASGIPGVKNYSQAMGVLNATVGSGDMTMQDLTDAMSTGVLAVIKGYGANIKDAGAALATFGDNNIRGAKAGTDLRMAVQALAVPVSTAKAQLASMGMTTSTLADNMQKHGLLSTLDLLQSKFKANGITAANEGQVITELFGKKAGVGLAILMEQMGRLQSKYPDLTKSANDFGNAWTTTLQTPQQKLKNLEQGAQAMAVTLGNIAMPAASAVLGGLDKAMSFVQDHAFASKGLTLGLGTLIAGGLTKGIFSGVEAGLSGIGKLGSLLNIPGAGKLAGVGQGAGLNASASALSGSASALDGAAASLEGAAGKLDLTGVPGKGGLPGVVPAGGAGATAAEEEAAAGLGAGGVMKMIGSAALRGGLLLAIEDIAARAGSSLLPKASPSFDKTYQTAPKPLQSAFNTILGQQGAENFGQFIAKDLQPAIRNVVESPFKALFPGLFGSTPAPGKDWTSVLGGSATYGRLPPPPPSSAPPPPAGIQQSGAPSAAYAGRFGPTTGAAPAQAAAPAAQPMDMIGGAGRPGTVQVPAPLTTGLDAAKAKVQADITAINSVMSGMKAKGVKIPAPDLSAMDTAKAKLQADLKGIDSELAKVTGKPSKIGAPDLSALDTAKAKAVADAGQIMQGLQTALQKVVKATAPDISAYRGAIGPAKADGVAISGGLAAGIQAGEGAAVAAAHAVAAAVTAALNISLQVKSPSKVTQKIGAATVEGLIVGLQGGQPALTAAATALGKTVAKAADVTAIDSAITKAIGYAGKDSALVTWLKGEQSKLTALAAQRTKLETEITDSTQIATSAVSGASIMNAGAYTPALANGPQSSQTTITGMQYMAGDQTAFAAQLKQLQKQGLNATSLSQLAQSGAQAGLPVAEGLTQGGKGAIAQVNALEKIVMKGSAAVGDVGGPAMYQAGAQLGQMAASGLKSQLGAIDAAMKAIGQAIVADLDKALHIKPPAATPSGSAAHKAHEAHEIHVHVHLDGQQIATSVQNATLAVQTNNWQSGLILPGRRP